MFTRMFATLFLLRRILIQILYKREIASFLKLTFGLSIRRASISSRFVGIEILVLRNGDAQRLVSFVPFLISLIFFVSGTGTLPLRSSAFEASENRCFHLLLLRRKVALSKIYGTTAKNLFNCIVSCFNVTRNLFL